MENQNERSQEQKELTEYIRIKQQSEAKIRAQQEELRKSFV